jgi:hypothetical protein
VHLVNEEHTVSGRLDFFDDLFQAFFKFATIFGTGDKRSDIKGEEAFVLQTLRDIASDNPLGKALDYGGFAHAWLTDQHGIVLGAAGEDLNDPLDFGLPSHDGVKAVGASGGREVDAELVDRRGSARLPGPAPAGRGGLLGRGLGENSGRLGPDAFEIHAKALENAGGDPFALSDEAQQ